MEINFYKTEKDFKTIIHKILSNCPKERKTYNSKKSIFHLPVLPMEATIFKVPKLKTNS